MTSPDLSFTVAGVGFSISLPPEPARLLRQLYAAFPDERGAGVPPAFGKPDASTDPAGKMPAPRSWSLVWEGNVCRISGFPYPVSVPGPHLIPAITTILVGKLLQRSCPGWVFLHGNGLVHRDSDRVLLLLGVSGSGKTTLGGLLQDGGEWDLLAEDLLIIDPHTATVHPFPRAATVRGGDEGLAWAGLGEEDEAKRLRVPSADRVIAARSLVDARVVFLTTAEPAEAPAPSGPVCHWVTAAPLSLLRRLEDRLGKPVRVQPGRDFTGLLLDPISAHDEADFEAILESEGALLLRSWSAAAAPRLRTFPPCPILEPLAAGEALPQLLGHGIRFGGPRPPATRMLMTMARAFAQARFFRFVSGGSPAAAAACLAAGVVGEVASHG